MTTQLVQQIKFGLWNVARCYPTLGYPLRYAGQLSTKNFRLNHKKKMERLAPSHLPTNRYIRENHIPTQCLLLLTKTELESDAGKGLALLLNHLRMPYRQVELANDLQLHNITDAPTLMISLGQHRDLMKKICASSPNNETIQILFGASPLKKNATNVYTVSEDPAELLPHKQGLRSNITTAFVNILKSIDQFPIITGFLTPQIGLRIDDVAGVKIDDYLPPIQENGWKPNLGIFIDDFQKQGTSSASHLSDLAKQAKLDLSPHALSADRFLFFDYQNGRPLKQEAFEQLWQKTRKAFDAWQFPVSSVLNAHFHVFSKACLPQLTQCGMRYIFSELPPDFMAPSPNANYLPSGDPLCTTGQIDNGPITIFSGDSAQDCNQPYSHYDFLMHRDENQVVEAAADKIIQRLKLSIESGFAAFITTHEYLLNTLSPVQHKDLWNTVQRQLQQFSIPSPKASLADIGQTCFDHTHTIIESISHQNGGWKVHLEGKASGAGTLSIFGDQNIRKLNVPSFDGEIDVELSP